MPPLTHQPLIEFPTELRIYTALLLPAVLLFGELRDQYADWRVRRMHRKVTAELREAGLIKEDQDEPHLILLPGHSPQYECSECSHLFLLGQWQTTANLADDFIEHLRVRHRSHYKFPIGVRITLAKMGE